MERVIVCDMLTYLRRHRIISKQQHGFLSNRSTTSNLLETFNDWTLALNSNNIVAVAYIDFAKAFDTVSHCKSMCKLESDGINSFLNG